MQRNLVLDYNTGVQTVLGGCLKPNTVLEAAILRTVLYADVFDFALRADELHHFLMSSHAVSLDAVLYALEESPVLREVLVQASGGITLVGRESLMDMRGQRDDLAARLWPKAAAAGQWLACVPFVRMVAVTGALAMDNPAHLSDDFDYFILTVPGRVWLARLLIIGVVRLSRLWGWPICPNFVLAADSLAQRRRDVYIAHEIAQAVPLADSDGLYAAFRAANAWTSDHLPNAVTPFPRQNISASGRVGRGLKRLGEWLLGGRLGDTVERWEQGRKVRRFNAQTQRRESAAQVDSSQVKGHFNDHGSGVIAQYHARLKTFGLEESRADLAAD